MDATNAPSTPAVCALSLRQSRGISVNPCFHATASRFTSHQFHERQNAQPRMSLINGFGSIMARLAEQERISISDADEAVFLWITLGVIAW
jgi:hypothetical protein